MTSLTTVATSLISTLGLTGVGIGLLVNCLGIPIPSEIIIPLAGIGIKQGNFNALEVFAVTVLAQLVGLYLGYAMGRFGGLELVQRYGKYVFISRRELKRAEVAFEQYGGRLVFFGLCLPGVHGYVGYPAGIARMPLWRFGIAAAAGAGIWSFVLLGAGYFLGDHLAEIDQTFRQFAVVIVGLLVVVAIWYIKRRNRKAQLEDSTDHAA